MPGRKAQIFTLDLLLAVVIMVIALMSLTLYIGGKPAPARDDIERLENLMTPGVPANWDENTVKIVGFLEHDGRFNETKIAIFEAQTPPVQRKWLGIRSDFTLRFVANNTTVACSSCGLEPATYKDLIPVRRYAMLGGNITKMEVLLYR